MGGSGGHMMDGWVLVSQPLHVDFTLSHLHTDKHC